MATLKGLIPDFIMDNPVDSFMFMMPTGFKPDLVEDIGCFTIAQNLQEKEKSVSTVSANRFFLKIRDAAAVLDRVFDPFVSADVSKNRRSSGLGIGLSIAKNLAMNNGYDLRIDKNVSNGSRLILNKYEHLM